MERFFRRAVLLLICACTASAIYQVQQENTYYAGGKFAYKGIAAYRCVRYCRKLGTCWGVDYFRYGGQCAVHVDGDSCDVTARREFKGADHFRVKPCVGDERFSSEFKKQTPPPEDKGLTELRQQLDAKMYTSDCYMNIYESSYVKSFSYIKKGGYGKSSGFLMGNNMTVSECAELCWKHRNCKAIDYEKDGGKCYVFSRNINVKYLTSDKCCHHVLVSCFAESHTATADPSSSPEPGYSPVPSATYGVAYIYKRATTTQTGNVVSSTTQRTDTPPYRSPTTTPFPQSTVRPPPPPIKLPDINRFSNKVCPFLVLPGTSRPGGKYAGEFVDSMEACLEFCDDMNADTVTCYSVDWNAQTTDCFYFPTEDVPYNLNYTDTYIYHFQNNPCDSLLELQCVVHPPMELSREAVIIGPLNNIVHTVQACDSYCFFRYAFMRTVTPGVGVAPDEVTSQEVVERGCGADMDDYMGWRQCAELEPSTTTTTASMCHCIGHVCNSVAVAASAHLYAYYPFDYDMLDLSGYNRHGEGHGTIKYTNLDVRSVRAAAVFDGTASVTVPGLTLVHRSEVQSQGDLRVSSAFTLWMRRLYGQDENMTIMSNAEKRGYSTIGIYSDVDPVNSTMHTITVTVRLMGETFSVTSHPLESGVWQFVCMNIRDSEYPPVMALYVADVVGLPPSEVSTIALVPSASPQGARQQQYLDLTSKTLTIGKQSGPGNMYPFKGELDELHFYQGELGEDDIWALMVQSYY